LAREIVFTFTDTGVSARAALLDDDAPKTCAMIWELLREPLRDECFHGAYSGTVDAIFFDPSIWVAEENATTYIQTGDVIFTHYEPNFRHGHHFPVSEIYWAYDRYARPLIPGHGTLPTMNIFGKFVGDPSEFYAASRALQRTGVKQLEVRRGE
jgi:hypothetical protein